MAYFTQQWSRPTVRSHEHEFGGQLQFDHTASNFFGGASVATGDTIYIVSWEKGALFLHGSLQVDKMVSQATAARLLGTDDLWEADFHVVAVPGSWTPYHFDVTLTTAQLDAVMFVGPDGNEKAPARRSNGRIDHQTFRNVREITGATALMFDDLLT